MSLPYAEVIGDPVTHSKSPAIHRFWLDRLGIPGDYRATSLRAADLPAYFAARRADPDWRGCNVTMPLKEAVLPCLSGLDAEAEATGAANMVRADLQGFNTDVAGVRDCLEDRAVSLSGAIRIVGTGGAARAAVRGVLLAGADRNDVIVHGRSIEKAGALARALLGEPKQGRALDPGELSGATLLINASPLGMKGFPPFPAGEIVWRDGATVFDMVYNPLNTRLLEAARRHDVIAIDGIDMLIGQARAAFRGFFGAEPPREADPELRGLLIA